MIYTTGDWMVKPGHEDEFVAAWRELAEWTAGQIAGEPKALLLRDVEQANRFRSFGPWEDMGAVQAWRASAGFQERVGRIRELLDGFEPLSMEIAAQVGDWS